MGVAGENLWVAGGRQEFEEGREGMQGFCLVDVKLNEQEAGKGAREREVGEILSWDMSKEAGRG